MRWREERQNDGKGLNWIIHLLYHTCHCQKCCCYHSFCHSNETWKKLCKVASLYRKTVVQHVVDEITHSLGAALCVYVWSSSCSELWFADLRVHRVTHRPLKSLIASEWCGSGTGNNNHHSDKPTRLFHFCKCFRLLWKWSLWGGDLWWAWVAH